jgi:hypothetical protein
MMDTEHARVLAAAPTPELRAATDAAYAALRYPDDEIDALAEAEPEDDDERAKFYYTLDYAKHLDVLASSMRHVVETTEALANAIRAYHIGGA